MPKGIWKKRYTGEFKQMVIDDDMSKRNPDLAEYARTQEARADSDPAIQTARFDDDPPMFGWRFRRRGLFRDLIDILLLSELFRRRRRF